MTTTDAAVKTGIEGLDELLCGGIPIKNKAAAADARRLRLDEIEHHLRRDGSIDRAPAFAQYG